MLHPTIKKNTKTTIDHIFLNLSVNKNKRNKIGGEKKRVSFKEESREKEILYIKKSKILNNER
jgi:hypothetical protein